MVTSRPRIGLSFDVEEWFQTHAAETSYPRDEWDSLESRVRGSLDTILALLDDTGSKATFFFLGWIAERYPELARAVFDLGHEVASHGFSHTALTSMDRNLFAGELEKTGKVFLKAGLPEPTGFRAPNFTLVDETLWAVDELIDRGYSYDSSIYPMFRHRYGMPGAPVDPFLLGRPGGSILELPMAVAVLGGRRIPVAGGAYMRFMPFSVYSRLLRRMVREDRIPVLYLHPWEFDSGARLSMAPFLQRVRQGHGAGRGVERKLRILLGRYESVRLADLASIVTDPPGWTHPEAD